MRFVLKEVSFGVWSASTWCWPLVRRFSFKFMKHYWYVSASDSHHLWYYWHHYRKSWYAGWHVFVVSRGWGVRRPESFCHFRIHSWFFSRCCREVSQYWITIGLHVCYTVPMLCRNPYHSNQIWLHIIIYCVIKSDLRNSMMQLPWGIMRLECKIVWLKVKIQLDARHLTFRTSHRNLPVAKHIWL